MKRERFALAGVQLLPSLTYELHFSLFAVFLELSAYKHNFFEFLCKFAAHFCVVGPKFIFKTLFVIAFYVVGR